MRFYRYATASIDTSKKSCTASLIKLTALVANNPVAILSSLTDTKQFIRLAHLLQQASAKLYCFYTYNGFSDKLYSKCRSGFLIVSAVIRNTNVRALMKSIETLIFSPHIDDEVLGCYCWLKPGTHVLFAGVEERPTIPKATRIKELEASSSRLGFSWQLLNNTVNQYQSTELIAAFESTIDQCKPHRVLAPEPSYNQDHRAVFDAAIVATRPHDTNWFAKEVLVFEQPHSVMWPHTPQPEPTYFVEIDIEKKLEAYALYASQVRGHRSPETVKAIAQLRGSQINSVAAEAFYVRRHVFSK